MANLVSYFLSVPSTGRAPSPNSSGFGSVDVWSYSHRQSSLIPDEQGNTKGLRLSFTRASGILLHPTSLPSDYGIGDLGEAAYNFVDFLRASEQGLWQILPLGPTGYGDSPYQCFSAFAGNPLLISPQQLIDDELRSPADTRDAPAFDAGHVDYGRVINFKEALLHAAYERFKHTASANLHQSFEEFCAQSAAWLDDYALYRALKNAHNGAAWNKWDAPLAQRDYAALADANEKLREEVNREKFYQFLFFRQWAALCAYSHERGVQLIGDVPIFVAHDSADVWSHPELFQLNEAGESIVVAGVPPDYFSRTGQRWGNPLYDWDKMREDGFRWWIERLRVALQTVDVLRIDHFRGFAACWAIPGADATAERGHWVNVPGEELFTAIAHALGQVPIIAEDLGVITEDVEALRDRFGFPGMRILQYAFGGDTRNRDLPHNHPRNSVAYTGTHDNNTTVGWFASHAGGDGPTRDAAQVSRERDFCLSYLNSNGDEIHWDFIRAALASVADTAIIPLQDVLGLGAQARMNLPASTTAGNWSWRYATEELTDQHSHRLRELTRLYGRSTHL